MLQQHTHSNRKLCSAYLDASQKPMQIKANRHLPFYIQAIENIIIISIYHHHGIWMRFGYHAIHLPFLCRYKMEKKTAKKKEMYQPNA